MKEFVEQLRKKADTFEKSGCAVGGIVKDYRKSADMIEKLCGKTNIGGFVKKLIERLEEKEEKVLRSRTVNDEPGIDMIPTGEKVITMSVVKKILNQLAEEYNQELTKKTQGYTSEKEEKIKVTELGVIVTGTKDKPYFEIKYKEVGKEDYNIGYSSYKLDDVLGWKEECFEIVTQDLRKENKGWIAGDLRMPSDAAADIWLQQFGKTEILNVILYTCLFMVLMGCGIHTIMDLFHIVRLLHGSHYPTHTSLNRRKNHKQISILKGSIRLCDGK